MPSPPFDSFIHLGARSEYSLGESLAEIEALCREAARDGQGALALTDVNTLASAPKFQECAQRFGIRPLFGLELGVLPLGEKLYKGVAYRLRLLVESAPGWRTLLRLGNQARRLGGDPNGRDSRPPHVPLHALLEDTRGLFLLVGGDQGELTTLLTTGEFERAEAWVNFLRQSWPTDRLFVELPDPSGPLGIAPLRMLEAASSFFGLRTVAVPNVSVAHPADDLAYRFFRLRSRVPLTHRSASEDGRTLAPEPAIKLPPFVGGLVRPVVERAHLAERDLIAQRFQAFPDAVAATVEIAERCAGFTLPLAERRFPIHDFTRGVDAESFLWNTAFERAAARYADLPTAFKDRLNVEYREIVEAGLANALVALGRLHEELDERGVLRGPGAGIFTQSLIASLLGVTRLDPLRFDLPFRLPDGVASRFPRLEFSVPSSQEAEATDALKALFGGQVLALGRWQTWRLPATLECIGGFLGTDPRWSNQIARDETFRSVREQMAGGPPAEANAALDWRHPAFVAWLSRRLEGRLRTLTPTPGAFTFSVEPVAHTLPHRPSRTEMGPSIDLCEWSEEEVTALRFGTVGFANPPILELLGEATQSVRSHGNPVFTPEVFALDDPETYRLLREGRTTGILPFEAPSVKEALCREQPTDLSALVRLFRRAPAGQTVDFPMLLLCHAAAAMKAHHPTAFYAAALTQADGDPRRISALLCEMRDRAIAISPLDVNYSDWRWTDEGRAVRPGFVVLRELPQSSAREMIDVRRELAFEDLADLTRRTDPRRLKNAHLGLLIRAGALDSFGLSRSQLKSQLDRLLPLLRPRGRTTTGEGQDALAFFGHSANWWLENHEQLAADQPGPSEDPAQDREAERQAWNGILLADSSMSPAETQFIQTCQARRVAKLSLRDPGRRVCLLGRIHAHDPLPDDAGVLAIDFDGCIARVDGAIARRAVSPTLSGRWCLMVGVLSRRDFHWRMDRVEALGTLEVLRSRAGRATSLQLEVTGLSSAEARALYDLIKAFPGPTPVRFQTMPADPPRALGKLAGRRVTVTPLLECELSALLTRKRWHIEFPPGGYEDSPMDVPEGTAAFIRSAFEGVGGRDLE